MSAHTPGPWKFHEQGDANDYCLLTHENNWVISFRQNGEMRNAEQRANAQLIAAAPDLLAALQSMEMALTGYTHQNDITANALAQCRTAIAKATGAER